MIPAVAVVGPTASGKTGFAIELAKRLNGEIISCDSMQIYKHLDIGTAKPSESEQAEVKHHLIDFLEIDEQFSVSDYVNLAEKTIEDLRERGKLPIITGGTGLYAHSLLEGISFQEDCRNNEIRENLTKQAEEGKVDELYEMLKQLDPIAANKIHPNNIKRVIRALEFCLETGTQFSSQKNNGSNKYNYKMLCLSYQNREVLYDRINKRVDEMMKSGLLDEAKYLYKQMESKKASQTVIQAIGYKEIFPYFEGKASIEEVAEKIKQGTRRYAKRQLTWFKRENKIEFIYMDEMDREDALKKAIDILKESEIV